MNYPESLAHLISNFAKLPGIGEKSAERLALAIVSSEEEYVNDFSASLKNAKQKLNRCTICGHLTENEICSICSDSTRDKNVICVIEDFKSIFAFESSGKFNGTYHVLNGLISPMDDIGPEDINIASLINRVEKLSNPELIFALKPTIEGETTTMYIKKLLENKPVTISRLAYGIPIGADLDYLDNITLAHALEDRKKI